ncbi:MAG: ribonuclease P protein component [bacterium]|nr:ribonuclease P protein component [bacterium]
MLPKNSRITKQVEWNKLHKFGSRAHSPELVMSYLKTANNYSRFGFIVGGKVSKKANIRNLIKRRIRAVIEKNVANIRKKVDIIFIAKAKIKDLNYQEIEKKVLNLLKKQQLLEDNE